MLWLGWRPASDGPSHLPMICVSVTFVVVAKGETGCSAALRFGVARSSAAVCSKRHPRATGSRSRGKTGGHRKPGSQPDCAFIKERISQTPHLTLHALKDGAAGVWVKDSPECSSAVLSREGCASKKQPLAPAAARTDIARRRQRWHSWQASLSCTPGLYR